MVDDEVTGGQTVETPGKRINPAIIALIVVISVAVAVVSFLAGRMSVANKHAARAEPPANAAAESAETTGDQRGILPLDTFTVNLDDPFGRRYIELELKLVIASRELVPRISENQLVMSKIRHEIFMTISAKNYNQLKGTAGKIVLFEEIQMRVNEILKEEIGGEPVIDVFQTRFLIQ
jgi:flagellar basal body-associated protein FliL